MDRIVQGRSADLYHTFYVGSTATNPSPDVATVTITRADGTPVVADAGAVDEGNGMVSYTLSPVDTMLLDRLSVVWSATFGGQVQTFRDTIEIVGDTFFTIADARQIKPLDNQTAYPDAKVRDVRTRVEQRIEKCLGYACVPRYTRETVSAYDRGPIALSHPYVRAIRSVGVGGVDLTAPEMAYLAFDGRFLYNGTGRWAQGWGSTVVAYEHGKDTIDEDIKAAALLLAKVWLVSGPVDDRALGFSDGAGGSYGLATPGRGGSWVGVPDVDAVIEQNRLVAFA